MRNSMDYIYTSGEQKIVIEVEQKSVRQSVAEQYVDDIRQAIKRALDDLFAK